MYGFCCGLVQVRGRWRDVDRAGPCAGDAVAAHVFAVSAYVGTSLIYGTFFCDVAHVLETPAHCAPLSPECGRSRGRKEFCVTALPP